MARQIPARPDLHLSVQQFNATPAGDLLGAKTQVVADGGGSSDVEVDVNANVHLSKEATNAFAFTGCDLDVESTPFMERTFKRAVGATQVVTVTLDQKIDGNTSYTLDTAGAALTIMPILVDGVASWIVKSALGTVSAVP